MKYSPNPTSSYTILFVMKKQRELYMDNSQYHRRSICYAELKIGVVFAAPRI